jgi:hypothetical protein
LCTLAVCEKEVSLFLSLQLKQKQKQIDKSLSFSLECARDGFVRLTITTMPSSHAISEMAIIG